MRRDNEDRLGDLLEQFVNAISHPRGRVLGFMADAAVTVPQVILLNFVSDAASTPSSLAARMKISLPSISQMVDRLVRLGLLVRMEDPADRRRKSLKATEKALTLLAALKTIRSAEYAEGTSRLSEATRKGLIEALARALDELASPPHEPGPTNPRVEIMHAPPSGSLPKRLSGAHNR
ncbi:MAG TPA: MarR family winged helix-turn-helix transcriptional regulator [Rhizobiaceae bacterium]|nr:MarR family winged helix-turn-helix transcriptional regulator [Rhizobiaceae bacterium]